MIAIDCIEVEDFNRKPISETTAPLASHFSDKLSQMRLVSIHVHYDHCIWFVSIDVCILKESNKLSRSSVAFDPRLW